MKSEDRKIWAAYARGVKPLTKGRKPASLSPPPGEETQSRVEKKTEAKTRAPEKKPPPLQTPVKPIALDRNLEKRLRDGDVTVDARLDLHEMDQAQAYRALNDFIDRHARANKRCLLIITGKGRNGNGVLRKNLPGWLEASSHATRILALRPAASKHGGDGAFYMMLRKGRSALG